MDLRIKETGEFKTLVIRDKNGIDFAHDLMHDDDQIKYNYETEEYETSQSAFDFWEAVIGYEEYLQSVIAQIKEFYCDNDDRYNIFDKMDRICAENVEEIEICAIRQAEALKEAFAEVFVK